MQANQQHAHDWQPTEPKPEHAHFAAYRCTVAGCFTHHSDVGDGCMVCDLADATLGRWEPENA